MDQAGLAAVVFGLVALGAIGFQVALAAGAPWGAYAMGGAVPGRFPPAMRVSALGQAVVIAALALVVLSAARLVLPSVVDGLPWLAWIPVAFSAVSVGLNGISPSAGERRIWVPATIILLITSLIVALAR